MNEQVKKNIMEYKQMHRCRRNWKNSWRKWTGPVWN